MPQGWDQAQRAVLDTGKAPPGTEWYDGPLLQAMPPIGDVIGLAGVIVEAGLAVRVVLLDLGSPAKESAVIPECTCHVRLASGICLPECPRGRATGRQYPTWDDVPNDVLLPDRYEARNGHPPPKCEKHDWYLYESDNGKCRICDHERRFPTLVKT